VLIKRKPKTPGSGRPSDAVMDAYAQRYGLTRREKAKLKTYIVQLALCQSEEARRLLLGVSRREDAA
jgi:hypothetical protein